MSRLIRIHMPICSLVSSCSRDSPSGCASHCPVNSHTVRRVCSQRTSRWSETQPHRDWQEKSVKPCDIGVQHLRRGSLNYTTQWDPTYLSSLTPDKHKHKPDPFHDKSFGFQAWPAWRPAPSHWQFRTRSRSFDEIVQCTKLVASNHSPWEHRYQFLISNRFGSIPSHSLRAIQVFKASTL